MRGQAKTDDLTGHNENHSPRITTTISTISTAVTTAGGTARAIFTNLRGHATVIYLLDMAPKLQSTPTHRAYNNPPRPQSTTHTQELSRGDIRLEKGRQIGGTKGYLGNSDWGQVLLVKW